MEFKHTPGPWHVVHWEPCEIGVMLSKTENGIKYYKGSAVGQQYYGIRANIEPTRHTIAASFEGAHIVDIDDYITHDGREESKANVLLMAAAPDLLQALYALYNAIDSCIDLTPEVLLRAKQAIDKATK